MVTAVGPAALWRAGQPPMPPADSRAQADDGAIDRVAALEAPLLGIETSNAEHRDLMDRVTEGGNGMRTEVMNAVTLA